MGHRSSHCAKISPVAWCRLPPAKPKVFNLEKIDSSVLGSAAICWATLGSIIATRAFTWFNTLMRVSALNPAFGRGHIETVRCGIAVNRLVNKLPAWNLHCYRISDLLPSKSKMLIRKSLREIQVERLPYTSLPTPSLPVGGSNSVRWMKLAAKSCVPMTGFGWLVVPEVWSTTRGSFCAFSKDFSNGKWEFVLAKSSPISPIISDLSWWWVSNADTISGLVDSESMVLHFISSSNFASPSMLYRGDGKTIWKERHAHQSWKRSKVLEGMVEGMNYLVASLHSAQQSNNISYIPWTNIRERGEVLTWAKAVMHPPQPSINCIGEHLVGDTLKARFISCRGDWHLCPDSWRL